MPESLSGRPHLDNRPEPMLLLIRWPVQSGPLTMKIWGDLMRNLRNILILLPIIAGLFLFVVTTVISKDRTEEPASKPVAPKKNPRVLMETSLGNITIELFPDKAPVTVANYLSYVDDGFYDGTVFHRVIPNFMIQGGGFTPDMVQKQTLPPIINEATNGLSNRKGTIAMARTMVVDSATSQFFINLVDNDYLDHRGDNPMDFGYCVFGQVTEGMDVVEQISAVPTGQYGPHQDVPLEPVVIKKITRFED